LIYYSPLLCTSWDVSKICLPPMYNVIECSQMTKFHQNFLSLLTVLQISIFCLISLYWTNRYPWRFDSIHFHCQENGIIFYSILKEFGQVWAGPRLLRIWISVHVEHRNVNLKAQDKAIDNNCTIFKLRIHFEMSTYPKQQERALKQ
jgi:hypothetical protein